MQSGEPQIQVSREGEATLVITVSGTWRIMRGIPALDHVFDAIQGTPGVNRLVFDTSGLARWDSSLLTYLKMVGEVGAQMGIEVD